MKVRNLAACLCICLSLCWPGAATASAEFDRHYEVGKDFLQREQYKLAVAEFTEALKQTKSATALVDRGTAYSELKNYQAALNDLTKAISIEPKNGLAYTIRGVVYFRSNRPQLAIKDFDTALTINPNDKFAVVNRAGAYLISENPGQLARNTLNWLDRTGWKSDFATHATVLTCLAYRMSHDDKQVEAISAQGLKKLDRLLWPYPLLKFWQNKIDHEKLLSVAEDSTYDLAQCQAFLGLDAFSKGDLSTARTKLSFVSNHGVVNSVEYWLAKHYLEKIDQKPQAAPILPVSKGNPKKEQKPVIKRK